MVQVIAMNIVCDIIACIIIEAMKAMVLKKH